MHLIYEFHTNDKYIIVVLCSTDVKLLITALLYSIPTGSLTIHPRDDKDKITSTIFIQKSVSFNLL